MSSATELVEISFDGRYTLPEVEILPDTAEEIRRKQERVRALCAERNAILSGRRCRKSPTRWRIRCGCRRRPRRLMQM